MKGCNGFYVNHFSMGSAKVFCGAETPAVSGPDDRSPTSIMMFATSERVAREQCFSG